MSKSERPPRINWSDEEDQLIRALYQTGGAEALVDSLPHRTRLAIQRRAATLGVFCRPKRLSSWGRWTNREDIIVHEHYPTGGSKVCMQHLPGRSAKAINTRAERLGVNTVMNKRRDYINHITLTTGHSRRSYRSEVGDEVVDILSTTLLPAALAGDGDTGSEPGPEILDTGLYLQADAKGRCGLLGAVVQPTGDDGRPYVPVLVFAVAAEARCASRLWDILHMPGTYFVTDSSQPPAPPWCAARIDPAADTLDHEKLMMLGDFERCIAWAWLERQ